MLTPGHRGDAPQARPLLAALPPPTWCLADAAYNSDALRAFLYGRGTGPVIPNTPTRKRVQPFDPVRYKVCNAVERTVGRLKDWRRVHTRYDKLASTVALAAILHGWC